MQGEETLRACARLAPPVLTVYLVTSEADASRHPRRRPCLTWLLEAAEELRRSLPHHDAKACDRQVRRVSQFLENRHPAERAIVIFAGSKTWQVIPLSAPVTNEIAWGKPKIDALLAALNGHRRYGAVIIDHVAARFFEFASPDLSLVGTKEFAIDSSQWKRKDQGSVTAQRVQKSRGPLRDAYEQRIAAQYKRLCHQVAQEGADLCAKDNLDGLFLVGPEHLTQAIFEKIPQHLAGSTVCVAENFGHLSPQTLAGRLKPLVESYEQEQELAVIKRLQNAQPGAVTNPDEVLAHLQNGTVRKVLVAHDLNLALRECPKCEVAATSADPVCAHCGAARIPITLGDLLARLAATRGVRVQFVNGEAADFLRKTGGLGAWLAAKRAAAS
jgi:peptide subunit release factor 1 (eRF1)